MLIYQVDNGGDNSGKKPSGGIVSNSIAASSMSVVVANPITFYGNISQSGQSGDLYNYYWTSYTRGTDGVSNNTKAHNLYLDSYIPLRYKSIYDPCPYGYRIPSNGTYNQFTNTGWVQWSYNGGTRWGVIKESSWLPSLGFRSPSIGSAAYVGDSGLYWFSIIFNNINVHMIKFYNNKDIAKNHNHNSSYGLSLRCIEECELLLARKI